VFTVRVLHSASEVDDVVAAADVEVVAGSEVTVVVDEVEVSGEFDPPVVPAVPAPGLGEDVAPDSDTPGIVSPKGIDPVLDGPVIPDEPGADWVVEEPPFAVEVDTSRAVAPT
jgi:hypothetical protein